MIYSKGKDGKPKNSILFHSLLTGNEDDLDQSDSVVSVCSLEKVVEDITIILAQHNVFYHTSKTLITIFF